MIIPFYDFNGQLTFDATKYAYCAGQAVAVGTLGVQTLPDLSASYLVGFGTPGGGDVGTAAWATPPVGNLNNTANLQHSHVVNPVTIAGHTHTISSDGDHDHGGITNQISLNTPSAAGYDYKIKDNGGWKIAIADDVSIDVGAGFDGGEGSHDHNIDTDGAHTHTGATGSTGLTSNAGTTDNQLSTTQDIRPRSVRVRWIMRIQ